MYECIHSEVIWFSLITRRLIFDHVVDLRTHLFDVLTGLFLVIEMGSMSCMVFHLLNLYVCVHVNCMYISYFLNIMHVCGSILLCTQISSYGMYCKSVLSSRVDLGEGC